MASVSGNSAAETSKSRRRKGNEAVEAYKAKRGITGKAGQMDRGTLQKAYGKTAYQKKIYGKNYKYGTLKNLNDRATKSHENAKTLRENLSKIKGQLSTADATTSEALKARIAKVQSVQQQALKNNKSANARRSNLVGMRKAAAANIVRKSAENPGAVARARKKLIKGQIERANNPPKGTSVA